jgi:primary-amine oxidase
MPAEHLRVLFKPQNFFKSSPSMDIPGVKDERSVAAFTESAECVDTNAR